MRIYRMTATFGKLEHATITLKPGLNIIKAPNEWGKSTWCAFLVNMLYGLDTRARSTATALADKDRYAPWSGSPMSGRIDLCWNGRDITIERSSKGRIVFGHFRAYETETGIEIPELNETNCGQMLLGVERSVFLRAGFLKQSDLPVTQDDSLRRRLNNLVTTGDESDASDTLAQQLRDLKNRCRYNHTGLLPQAEAERDQISHQLTTLHDLQNQIQSILSQQAILESGIEALKNHADTLKYRACRDNQRKIHAAEQSLEDAKIQLSQCIAQCESLPPVETIREKVSAAQVLQEAWQQVQIDSQMLPPIPLPPSQPAYYQGMTPDAVRQQTQADLLQYRQWQARQRQAKQIWFIYAAIAAALALICGIFLLQWLPIMVAIVALCGGVIVVLRHIRSKAQNEALTSLMNRHGNTPPDTWAHDAEKYIQAYLQYELLLENTQLLRNDLSKRTAALQQQTQALTGGLSLLQITQRWKESLAKWEALADAQHQLQQAQEHLETLRSIVITVDAPKRPSTLTYDAEQTQNLLTEAQLRLRQLHIQLGQCQGQAQALGSEAQLRARLDTLNLRISRLEDTYYALEMALDAQREASLQLQRRFAPMISKRAQALFSRLTCGRYQRLNLGSDLNVHSSAEGEDTLHPIQWRSDGTADQQYLALRLAIAEELTPHAPLILDDALVRFDDQRLGLAMEIFLEVSRNKQVILFTCQSRESNYITEE